VPILFVLVGRGARARLPPSAPPYLQGRTLPNRRARYLSLGAWGPIGSALPRGSLMAHYEVQSIAISLGYENIRRDAGSTRPRSLPPSDRAPRTLGCRGRRSPTPESAARRRAVARRALRGPWIAEVREGSDAVARAYLAESSPRLQHFAEVTASLTRHVD